MLYVASFLPIDCEGTYSVKRLKPEEIKGIIGKRSYRSTVTWRTTAEVLEQVTGLVIPMPRETEERVLHVRSGDEVIIAKPLNRKRPEADPSEFEFLHVRFE